MRNSELMLYGLLFVLATGNWQCYEHEEGCMDIRAENYSVEADNACEDCCNYPSLILEVSHIRGEEPIDTNYLWDAGDDTFRIRSLNFFLSGFALRYGQLHDSVTIEETIEILPNDVDGETYVPIAFPVAKINLGRGNDYVLGSFRHADNYEALQVDFGIRSFVNHAGMDRISSSNALYQNQDSMYIGQEDGFYFLKMDLLYNGETEKNIRIFGDEYLVSLIFDHSYDFTQREDRRIPLTIDYEKWFGSIDFLNDPEDKIAEKLLDELGNALIFE